MVLVLFLVLRFLSQQDKISDLCSRDPTADALPMPPCFCALRRSKTTVSYIYFLKKDSSDGVSSSVR